MFSSSSKLRVLLVLCAASGLFVISETVPRVRPETHVGNDKSLELHLRDNGRRSPPGDREPPSNGSSGSDGTNTPCRVAVCFSGHIRSFVYPVVHQSIRRNLIDAIAQDSCRVDIFAYATLPDEIPRHKHNTDFTPKMADVEAAMAVLAPTKLQWHHDQAGIVPGSSSGFGGGGIDSSHNYYDTPWLQEYVAVATPSLHWQLFKSSAAYRMATREEELGGFWYDWIVRTRFDTAWTRPLPPLRSFSREVVWFGSHMWPMADQFALVPRAFADRFFDAISAFYACDGMSWPPSAWWWTPSCSKYGFEESVLFRYLHSVDIPYRGYPLFKYTVVRGVSGGVYGLGLNEYQALCEILESARAFGDDQAHASLDCLRTLANWSHHRVRALLPAGHLNDSRRAEYLIESDLNEWEQLVMMPFSAEEQKEVDNTAQFEAINAKQTAAEEDVVNTGTSGTTIAAGVLQFTKPPRLEDLANARARLIALRDAIYPPRSFHGSISDDLDNTDVDGTRYHSRRDRWNGFDVIPPLQYDGRAPYLVYYFTMGISLVAELADAFKCHLNRIAAGESAEYVDTNGNSCEEGRSLEEVMIDISMHTEELGVCTIDPTTGISVQDQVRSFFKEPARHCVGYGRSIPDLSSPAAIVGTERTQPSETKGRVTRVRSVGDVLAKAADR